MFHTKIVMFNNMVIMDRWKFSRCTLCSITKLLINCHIMSSWESFIENRWILNMAYFVLNVISMISPFSPHSNATTTAKFYKCIRNSHFTRNSQIGVCCKLESIGINVLVYHVVHMECTEYFRALAGKNWNALANDSSTSHPMYLWYKLI